MLLFIHLFDYFIQSIFSSIYQPTSSKFYHMMWASAQIKFLLYRLCKSVLIWQA